MKTIAANIKPARAISYWKGDPVWNQNEMKQSPNPELCHCGGTALYRHDNNGYCKAHHADAVAASKSTRARNEFGHSTRRPSRGAL